MEALCDRINEVNNWGMKTKYSVKCTDCGQEEEISTVLNPLYFFTMPSRMTNPDTTD
jgi:hypothetical protein